MLINAQKLRDLANKNIVPALRTALNRTGMHIKKQEVSEIGRVFDRPTRFTLNSVEVELARGNKLRVVVRIKDAPNLGDKHYLSAQVRGGGRRLKRYEYLLQRYGYLPAGKYTVPGKGARLDGNGNMSPGQIVQILSCLRAFPETGYMANATERSMARNRKPRDYMIMRNAGGTPTGIYQRLGNSKFPMPVLIFVDQPKYTKRFNFMKVAENATYERFRHHVRVALKELAG